MTPKKKEAGMLGGYEAGKLKPETFSIPLHTFSLPTYMKH